ncbi:uncharacterized protein Dsimw501_GD14335, isoform B [Drosophila simulans]|uniref:GD14335 n=1 Tax=Drosophila simulans TaxID=7240 RepID=B4QQP0_DROSI|nr:GD14335 [Drosophila simulans]KMY99092.1 uncharacterized protein Dsimw501_GD14335, isoform A [Drosophila simulans]KMY99093.1 uncharacterized protein Dsimw501_GD14335, isoform B [Drosophila simulans]
MSACMILDAARLYNLEKLTEVCLMFMDRNADDVLLHDTFDTLSKESLEEVLRRDCFFAPEVQIFSSIFGGERGRIDVSIAQHPGRVSRRAAGWRCNLL